MRFALLLSLLPFLFLQGCTGIPTDKEINLKPAAYSDLPGWGQDDTLLSFTSAFEKSCARILKSDPDRPFGPLPQAGRYVDWQGICIDLQALDKENPGAVRAFIERHFTPYSIRAGREDKGLFTGYYEASLNGSRLHYGPYRYPLHKRPGDLVMVHLGEFRNDLKGRRIAGRVIDGTLKPYEPRADIVAGNWPHNDEVLVWVDDPVDAFFVQIQGSGVVRMDEGVSLRIGYAGQNGHPYYAIGRELIRRGELDKDNVSMQTIRSWLENNPGQAEEIMNTNRSYVFFRELEDEGPLGAEGVPLTPLRSLAVDRTFLPYGLPLWVDIEEPVENTGAIRRLMIAQDTGGAIRGAVRGDVFWGHGDKAEYFAGEMKSEGRYWALLPRIIGK